MAPKPKRPRDVNQRAKLVVDIATGESQDLPAEKAPDKERAGKLGGESRAAKLTPAQRAAIAKQGARARWQKPR